MATLKEKSEQILTEKELKIIPENIRKDTQIFDIVGEYEGQVINNQDKTITSNGTYQADQGYTGLGTVTVNVSGGGGSGDIKLFETIEEMQADPSPEEGDLAVVYRNEIQNWQEDTEAQIITFPNTVTLSQAFTGDIYGSFRGTDESMWFDAQIQLSASRFRFEAYGEEGMIEVGYTSSDGITYTKTQGDDSVDCGTPIVWQPYEEWNNAIGYFMQTGGKTFDGFYEYTEVRLPNKYRTALSNKILTINYVNPTGYVNFLDRDNLIIPITITNNEIIDWYIISPNTTGFEYRVDTVSNKLYGYATRTIPVPFTMFKYVNGVYSEVSYRYSTANVNQLIIDDGLVNDICSIVQLHNVSGVVIYDNSKAQYFTIYVPAPSQLDAIADDVYEKTFYGKDGVEEGTLGTNPSNLFDDAVASVIYSANEAYATMSPLKITAANKNIISDNIRFIPVNSQGEALLDVSELADVQSLFADKIYLKDIPCEFGNVYYMSSMCNGCSNLITFPYINATNSQHANYLCYNCTNLKNVPAMDFANTNTWPNAFSGCPSLSDESLNNILAICISATKSATKTLKYIGLSSTQATTCTTLSNWSACQAAGWSTGY